MPAGRTTRKRDIRVVVESELSICATRQVKKVEYNPDSMSLEKKLEDLLETTRLVLRSDARRILDEGFAVHSRTREGNSNVGEGDPVRRIPRERTGNGENNHAEIRCAFEVCVQSHQLKTPA